jgi:3-oxoacyl-[acyl-carrier protein] reductase
MADRYQQLVNTPVGRLLTKQVGLPQPVSLERYEPGQPVISGPVLLGAAPGGRLHDAVRSVLDDIRAEVAIRGTHEGDSFKALVFDATGITDAAELKEAWGFFHPTIRRVQPSGRVIVLGTPPEECEEPAEAIAQRALEGLVRSIGKEVRRGCTAQTIYVSRGGEQQIGSTLRFFLSPKSAYVSGQVVRIGASERPVPRLDWERPLSGTTALVTGAARGIGASIAEVLARDGADVVGVDIPGQPVDIEADITDEDAPKKITDHLLEQHGGVDIVVHNAGITRDKTLGRMDESLWQQVIDINLIAPHRIDHELFGRKAVRDNGRIVAVSSISGIAGNAGQTNYATSKAGIIGMVQAWKRRLGEFGVTINAVAPGFIETRMTAAMPIATREAGRRMNSLSQGGLPVDVAETISWFASPASGAVTGNVVRVCGQSLIGA